MLISTRAAKPQNGFPIATTKKYFRRLTNPNPQSKCAEHGLRRARPGGVGGQAECRIPGSPITWSTVSPAAPPAALRHPRRWHRAGAAARASAGRQRCLPGNGEIAESQNQAPCQAPSWPRTGQQPVNTCKAEGPAMDAASAKRHDGYADRLGPGRESMAR